MASTTTQAYRVGLCPACHTELYAEAVIELVPPSGTAPDPRAEGEVTLTGKITGAKVRDHDCRKKVTR